MVNPFDDDFDASTLSEDDKLDAALTGLIDISQRVDELNEKFDELLEKLANLSLGDYSTFN